MLDRLYHYANGKNTLYAFFLYLIFGFGIMPYAGSLFEEKTNHAKPIDLMIPTYTPDEAYQALKSYGEEGRSMHRFNSAVLDVVYPLVYTLFTILTLAYLWKNLLQKKSWLKPLPLLPLITLLVDFGENYFVIQLIDLFPERNDQLASVAANFSLAKWTLVFIGLGMIIPGVFYRIYHRYKTK